eukprot:3070194-Pleurochrysis_carterae.AAC.1
MGAVTGEPEMQRGRRDRATPATVYEAAATESRETKGEEARLQAAERMRTQRREGTQRLQQAGLRQ